MGKYALTVKVSICDLKKLMSYAQGYYWEVSELKKRLETLIKDVEKENK